MFLKRSSQQNIAPGTAESLAEMHRKFTVHMILCVIITVTLTVSLFAWGTTRAWFVKNQDVAGGDSAITTDTNTSLFISAGRTVDFKYYLSLVTNWPRDAKLFPISTRDCGTWWYADTFGSALNNAGTAYEAKATHYTSVTSGSGITVTSGAAIYNNSLDGNGKVAYVLSEYMLYTNEQPMSVYLDPAPPITVSYSDPDGSRDMPSAPRIGVETGGTLKFIYAPAAESGTGNSEGTLTNNTFYGVNSATAVSELNTVLTSLSGYTATATGNSMDPYSAGGASTLGTADPNGLQVRVYVWLEGTDAQAMLGTSDNDLQGLNVDIKYVGILNQ